MHMHDRVHVRPGAKDRGMDEDLVRRFKPGFGLADHLAVEIDLNDLLGRGVADAKLARPAGADERAVASGDAGAHMPRCRLGDVEPAEDAAGLGYTLAEIALAHAAPLLRRHGN